MEPQPIIVIDTKEKLLEHFGKPMSAMQEGWASWADSSLMGMGEPGLIRVDAEMSPNPEFVKKLLERPTYRSVDDEWNV